MTSRDQRESAMEDLMEQQEPYVVPDPETEQDAPAEDDRTMDEPDLGGEGESVPPPEAVSPGEEIVADDDSPPAAEQTAFAHGSMDLPVSRRISDREMADRGLTMARRVQDREALVAKKAAANKSFNAQIQSIDEDIAALSRGMLDGHEESKQGDLFVGEIEAAQGIAAVATAAGDAPEQVHEKGACELFPEMPHAPRVCTDPGALAEAKEAFRVYEAGRDKTFTCVECAKDASTPEEAIHDESEGVFLDSEGRKVCTAHHDEAIAAAGAKSSFECEHAQIAHRLKADRGTICPECLESVKALPLDPDLQQLAEGAETILENRPVAPSFATEDENPDITAPPPRRRRKPEAQA